MLHERDLVDVPHHAQGAERQHAREQRPCVADGPDEQQARRLDAAGDEQGAQASGAVRDPLGGESEP
ncbi:hypothetical protein ACFYZJ_05410 [Streptomyces sp. NPDC001848]|uniref:hypothetical protein n=1 Tax=Streptomyces sp. NPDC001848 TaxID=3364618 RepID=UPI0036738BF3